MKPAQHPTALRTSQILRDAGIDTNVVEFEQPTRTSVEAAAAIGCSVAEIAKSIVFRGKNSGQAVVASDNNRVGEAKVAAQLGESLIRADADFVRTTTDYAIGGVAPIGHSQPVKLLFAPHQGSCAAPIFPKPITNRKLGPRERPQRRRLELSPLLS